MRRVIPVGSFVCLQPGTAATFFVPCKGIEENRIFHMFPKKSIKDFVNERNAKVEASKVTNPRNRKEELQHLTQRCSHEYNSDLQRTANDFMQVSHDPRGYAEDMAYTYHRIWRVMTPSKRGIDSGNDCFQIVKVFPTK